MLLARSLFNAQISDAGQGRPYSEHLSFSVIAATAAAAAADTLCVMRKVTNAKIQKRN